jgi:hypothetical protein
MKKKSFISAYIAVSKGSDIGIESLYAQQIALYEQRCLASKKAPKLFCPRQDGLIGKLWPSKNKTMQSF